MFLNKPLITFGGSESSGIQIGRTDYLEHLFPASVKPVQIISSLNQSWSFMLLISEIQRVAQTICPERCLTSFPIGVITMFGLGEAITNKYQLTAAKRKSKWLILTLWLLIKGDAVCWLVSAASWVQETCSFSSFLPQHHYLDTGSTHHLKNKISPDQVLLTV